MANIETNKKEVFRTLKTYCAKFMVGDGGLQVNLPLEVAEYLCLKRGHDLFFCMVNGTVQLCSHEPKAALPVLDGDGTEAFVPVKPILHQDIIPLDGDNDEPEEEQFD